MPNEENIKELVKDGQALENLRNTMLLTNIIISGILIYSLFINYDQFNVLLSLTVKVWTVPVMFTALILEKIMAVPENLGEDGDIMQQALNHAEDMLGEDLTGKNN